MKNFIFLYDLSKENSVFVDKMTMCCQTCVRNSVLMDGEKVVPRRGDIAKRWYETQYHVTLYHVLFNMIQA